MSDQRAATPATGNTPAENDSDSTRGESPAPAAPERRDKPREYGGPKGPEPTRYGDWEQNGRCTDF